MAECPNCSAPAPDDSNFCPNCGTVVQSLEGEQTPQMQQSETTNPLDVNPYRHPVANERSARDARNFAVLAHLSAFSIVVVPFGNLLGPLLVWLLKRADSPFIDSHGKAALNFQISMTIYIIISIVLILAVIGIFMLIALGVFSIIVTIIAAVRASNGEQYQYPLAIKFIK